MLETIREKWPEILNSLKQEYDITDVSFKTWLLPLEVRAVENDTIILVVPEETVGLQYIKKKYSTPCFSLPRGGRLVADTEKANELLTDIK